MPQIKDALVEGNPWWKGEFLLEYKEREVYSRVKKFMRMPQMVALTGLRRVGKTTLLLKIVKDSLDRGADPSSILYFSFDEFRGVELREVLKSYEALLERDLRDGGILLLDEVQKLEGWEDQVKRVYDTYKKVKIVLSGSESLFLGKGKRESLAGRMFEILVKPLTFREFLGFMGVNYQPVGLHEKELARLFEKFLLTSGFPELVNVKDRDIIRTYIQETVVEKIIYRDIPTLFPLKDVSVLDSIFTTLFEEPGQLIDIQGFSQNLGLSRHTLSKYLKYLEDSYLVAKLYNYSRSRRKTERKLKKYYPTVLNADALAKGTKEAGSIFENAVVLQAGAEFFWRDSRKNEVDIVLANRKPVPVEVKSGKIEVKGLHAFMKAFKVKESIIITHDREETIKKGGKTIKAIPAYKFFLK
ncbi:MAG: ATP-binding protein [Candidatus Aenigmarchaeota archaeon]|nr:ATP-binding protein [Candidatus Aenigmarchaeota archaeon]